MKMDKYQEEAVKLAIYPGKLSYPALGLCGEAGELTAAWEGSCNDDFGVSVVKEAGDVLWYIANLASDCDLKLSDIMGIATFPRTELVLDFRDLFIDIHIQAAKIAENVKKTFRDHGGFLTDKRREAISEALRLIIIMLASILSWSMMSLSECSELNLNKLRSRKDRGTLKGDGDDR